MARQFDASLGAEVKFVLPSRGELKKEIQTKYAKTSPRIPVSLDLPSAAKLQTLINEKYSRVYIRLDVKVNRKQLYETKRFLANNLEVPITPKLVRGFRGKIREQWATLSEATNLSVHVRPKVLAKDVRKFRAATRASFKVGGPVEVPFTPDISAAGLEFFRTRLKLALLADPISVPIKLDIKQANVVKEAAAAGALAGTAARKAEEAVNRNSIGLRFAGGNISPVASLFNPKTVAVLGTIASGAIAVGAAFAGATFAGAQFSAELSKIAALGEFDLGTRQGVKDLEELKAAILAVGSARSGPALSVGESGTAIREAIKAGLKVDEAVSGLAPALKLAVIGGEELDDVFVTLAQSQSTFNLKAEDFTRIAAAINTAAQETSGSIKDFSDALIRVGPSASIAGFSIDETLQALAVLAKGGIKGGTAGTQLARVLDQLVIPKSAAAKAVFEDIGFSAIDAAGNTKDLQTIFTEFSAALDGLSESDRLAKLQTVFGTGRGGRNAAALIVDQTDRGVKLQEFAGDVEEFNRIARESTDNLAGDFDRLAASITVLFSKVGTAPEFVEPLREIVQDLQRFVLSDETTKGLGAVLDPVAAGLGTIFSSIETNFDSAIPFFKRVGSTFNEVSEDVENLVEGAAKLASTLGAGFVEGAASGVRVFGNLGQAAASLADTLGGLVDLTGRFAGGFLAGQFLQRALIVPEGAIASMRQYEQAAIAGARAQAQLVQLRSQLNNTKLTGIEFNVLNGQIQQTASVLAKAEKSTGGWQTALYNANRAAKGFRSAFPGILGVLSIFGDGMEDATKAVTALYVGVQAFEGLQAATAALRGFSTAAKELELIKTASSISSAAGAASGAGGAVSAASGIGAAASGVGALGAGLGTVGAALPIVGGVLALGATAFALFGNNAEGASKQVKELRESIRDLRLDTSLSELGFGQEAADELVLSLQKNQKKAFERLAGRTKDGDITAALRDAFNSSGLGSPESVKAIKLLFKADKDAAEEFKRLAKNAGVSEDEVIKQVILSRGRGKITKGLAEILEDDSNINLSEWDRQEGRVFRGDELGKIFRSRLGGETKALVTNAIDSLKTAYENPEAVKEIKAASKLAKDEFSKEIVNATRLDFEQFKELRPESFGKGLLAANLFGITGEQVLELADEEIVKLTGGIQLGEAGRKEYAASIDEAGERLAGELSAITQTVQIPVTDLFNTAVLGFEPEEPIEFNLDTFAKNVATEAQKSRDRLNSIILLEQSETTDATAALVQQLAPQQQEAFLSALKGATPDQIAFVESALEQLNGVAEEAVLKAPSSTFVKDFLKKVYGFDDATVESVVAEIEAEAEAQKGVIEEKLSKVVQKFSPSQEIEADKQAQLALRKKAVSAVAPIAEDAAKQEGQKSGEAYNKGVSEGAVSTTAIATEGLKTSIETTTTAVAPDAAASGTAIGTSFSNALNASITLEQTSINLPLQFQYMAETLTPIVAVYGRVLGISFAEGINNGLTSALRVSSIISNVTSNIRSAISLAAGAAGGPPPKKRLGGVLSFPNNTAGLVLAHQGEGVLPPETMRLLGPETFEALRTRSWVPNVRAKTVIDGTGGSSVTTVTSKPGATSGSSTTVNQHFHVGTNATNPENVAHLLASRLRPLATRIKVKR